LPQSHAHEGRLLKLMNLPDPPIYEYDRDVGIIDFRAE